MKKQNIKSLLLVPLVFASITTGVVYAEEQTTSSSIRLMIVLLWHQICHRLRKRWRINLLL